MAVALIYCADGNPAFARAAIDAGWLYGARLPAWVGLPIYFADQDWRSPDRAGYMAAIGRHRPEMAVVLDYEHPDQRDEVLSWAEEAAQYVRRVVIVPKVPGTLGTIPGKIGRAEVVLGYSVPTSYGASPVPTWEFGRRPAHLLGGSPQRQMELAGYLNVVSADGNMPAQQARRCRFWSPTRTRKGRWARLSEVGDTGRGDGADLRAFRLSLANIRAAWERLCGSRGPSTSMVK